MQVMPETARAMKVGDIHRLEPNIHAGVKYLRELADRHFPDSGLDAFNRTLFTFAAYNAGPTRISSLRHEAQQSGLNPIAGSTTSNKSRRGVSAARPCSTLPISTSTM